MSEIYPDYTEFIDLTLFDKSPEDILAAAQNTLQSRVPEWEPDPTNMESMLMEAMAVEVAEAVFSLNRLPVSMLRALLALYGVPRDAGAPPYVDVLFTAQDDAGYVVPAGTELALPLGNDEFLPFFTNIALTIPNGSTTGVVRATSTEFTNVANGTPAATECQIINPVLGIDTAVTDDLVFDGRLAESVDAWTLRARQRLLRLVETLVVPNHFVQAALENSFVYRATAIDNYDPGAYPAGDPGDHPGNITVVVYGDNMPLSSEDKTDLDTFLAERAQANLLVHVVDPDLEVVDVEVEITLQPNTVEATVVQAVEDRLNAYLNTNNWLWGEPVRRNELISVIDQVAGVNYIADLIEPAADVTLPNGLTLVTAGTVTVTVV